MSGPPVSVGCVVIVTPGLAGAPDTGTIVMVPPTAPSAAGLPLAVSGSLCQMVNSVTGAPYPLTIGSTGASTGVTVDGAALVRVGDQIPSGSGVLAVVGPPAAPYVIDGNAP